MKYPEYVLLIGLFLLACGDDKKGFDTAPIPNVVPATAAKDTLVPLKTSSKNLTLSIKCDCNPIEYRHNLFGIVFFQKPFYKKMQKEQDSIFEKWSNDTLRLGVKKIRFSGYDTIPARFSVFENVEEVMLYYHKKKNGLSELEMFPKLKSLFLWGAFDIEISQEEKWLKKIELLRAEKSRITGINSFNCLPKLKVLVMGYSGFKIFPKNIESLKCLQQLELGAYMGKLDLAEINVSQMPCLIKATFTTNYNVLTGLPSGLLESNITNLLINHQQLTDLDREILKKYKEKKRN